MNADSQQIVQKLWSYCNILRDDGLSYPDYVEQLTYLLFLKMAHERGAAVGSEGSPVPAGYSWQSLVEKEGEELKRHYDAVLHVLSEREGMLGLIFKRASNKIRDPDKLRLLIVDLIDKKNWSALDADVKGDAYEGLLEKNAQDTKSGAGQYFTPRPVVDAVVECVRPQPGEVIHDPACGTGGFLLSGYDFVRKHYSPLTPAQDRHLRQKAIRGTELVDAVTRLGAMNLLLHGIGSGVGDKNLPIETSDSLSHRPKQLYDVILTNPPFGTKSSVTFTNDQGGRERQALSVKRDDFFVTTSNKQLNFLQHAMSILTEGGRAAIVVSDNVLFEGGAGERVRQSLLQQFELHTLLRLPKGIFYAQGVTANVLFFDKPKKAKQKDQITNRVWIYDLRTGMNFTLRNNPLKRSDLEDFVASYRPEKRFERIDGGENGRWRAFSYEDIMSRDKCNMDITWLREDGGWLETARPPEEIADDILEDLHATIDQLTEVARDLG